MLKHPVLKRFAPWLLLAAGLLVTVLLARLGNPGEVHAASRAVPVSGHQAATGYAPGTGQITHEVAVTDLPEATSGVSDRSTRVGSLVTVRGVIEHLKRSPQGGITIHLVAEDGTPMTCWAGPDVTKFDGELRDRVAVMGRRQGELFVVHQVEREDRLTGGIPFRVSHYSNGWAHCYTGTGQWVKFPVGNDWDTSRDIIWVSRRGGRYTVE